MAADKSDDKVKHYKATWPIVLIIAVISFIAFAILSLQGVPPFNIQVNPDKVMANAAIIGIFSILYSYTMMWMPKWWTSPLYEKPTDQADAAQRGIYFAFITHSTVGYGDFSPTHPITRALVILHLSIMIMYNFLS